MIPEHFEMIRRRRECFWWYVGRRDLFSGLLGKYLEGPAPTGLDAGCGPGTNDSLYAPFARRWICGDIDRESFSPWRPPALGQGVLGDLAHLPVRAETADLALLLDVIEHLPREGPALDETFRALRPGGLLLVSVPAFRALWSRHDEQAGHHRRYRMGEAADLIRQAGFEILEARYYNWLLSIPIFLVRRIAWRVPSMKTSIEADLSPGILNGVFRAWLALENGIARLGVRWPWGTTAVLLARKPQAPQTGDAA